MLESVLIASHTLKRKSIHRTKRSLSHLFLEIIFKKFLFEVKFQLECLL